ncbi:hypothetical protein BDQ17DRAFT_1376263 [Cyathus striatus]|nr:hypothetical protein BDQ17DRAFT_1380816 [Cyathus striatus]KAF8986211.1 hypothetical protein BDQ17DRAFT_1376263 [Cyathus striatus]
MDIVEFSTYRHTYQKRSQNMDMEAYKQFCHVVGQKNKKLKSMFVILNSEIVLEVLVYLPYITKN